MTRHPFVTAAAVALTIFVLVVAPCMWLARLVDDALRTTPAPHPAVGRTIGWWPR